jgi:hypothetical protein
VPEVDDGGARLGGACPEHEDEADLPELPQTAQKISKAADGRNQHEYATARTCPVFVPRVAQSKLRSC